MKSRLVFRHRCPEPFGRGICGPARTLCPLGVYTGSALNAVEVRDASLLFSAAVSTPVVRGVRVIRPRAGMGVHVYALRAGGAVRLQTTFCGSEAPLGILGTAQRSRAALGLFSLRAVVVTVVPQRPDIELRGRLLLHSTFCAPRAREGLHAQVIETN